MNTGITTSNWWWHRRRNRCCPIQRRLSQFGPGFATRHIQAALSQQFARWSHSTIKPNRTSLSRLHKPISQQAKAGVRAHRHLQIAALSVLSATFLVDNNETKICTSQFQQTRRLLSLAAKSKILSQVTTSTQIASQLKLKKSPSLSSAA